PRERTGDDQLAVTLKFQRENGLADRRRVAGVERAVRVQSREVVAGGRGGAVVRVKGGERAADEDFSVRLHPDRVDRVVRAGIEALIERAVGVEAREKVAG